MGRRYTAQARTANIFNALSNILGLSPHLDFRRLRYFVTVAEELHFGRAAKRLQVAQPALSQQIRKLENELGVELFHRERGRRIVLTEPGAVLLDEGRRVLARASDAVLSTQRAARGETGSLRVAFAPSTAVSVLPLCVRIFRQSRPQVRLDLREMLSDEMAQAIRTGDFDVGLMRAPTNPAGLVLEVIAEEPLFVALPSGHRLAGEDRLTVEELAEEPLVASSSVAASGWHQDVFSLYRRRGIAYTVAQEVSTIQAQLGLVAAGVGIALVPSSVRELQLAGISMLPVDAPLLKLLVGRREGKPSATLEQFVDSVREAGTEWSRKAQPQDAALPAASDG
jgi:DNA-binding transcriptional LysR family regulator